MTRPVTTHPAALDTAILSCLCILLSVGAAGLLPIAPHAPETVRAPTRAAATPTPPVFELLEPASLHPEPAGGTASAKSSGTQTTPMTSAAAGTARKVLPAPPAAARRLSLPGLLDLPETSADAPAEDAFAVAAAGSAQADAPDADGSPTDAAPSSLGPQAGADGDGQAGSLEAGGTGVHTLVHGQGEGRQPAPAYPASALARRQQGSVAVEFSVGTDGRVLHAEAAASSGVPALDSAAVRTVRQRWRFAPGRVRHYRVNINFRIN